MAALPPFDNGLNITESVANFFKVIVPSTLENRKLAIPKKFTREYGEELSDVATLIVPNGDIWRMRLERDSKRIRFVHEWNTFVAHYSITDGQFLIFSYQGHSLFHVHVLDFSCCEIKYPRAAEGIKQEDYAEEHFSEARPSSDKGKGKCVDQHATRKRKKIAIPKRVKSSKLMLRRMPSSHADPIRKNKYVRMFVENITEYTYPHKKATIAEEREKLIRATEMFKLEHPFFAVILGQSNFHFSYMYVPSGFRMRYMRGSHEYIKVEDSDGKQWDFDCTDVDNSRVRIGKGCAKFFKENDLKNGDFCLFELINKKDVVLKFSVLCAAEYVNAPDMVPRKVKKSETRDRGALYISKKINQLVISEETKKAMAAAKASEICYPAFMIILTNNIIRRCTMFVPQDFIIDHLHGSDGCGSYINLRASSRKQWRVRWTYNPQRRAMRLSTGLITFCKENNLKSGDVCVFELIKNKPVKFKVSVFYASEYAR